MASRIRSEGSDATVGVQDLRDRELVASYRTYPEAEAAVDALSDGGFPVRHLSIVAEGLAYVENVTGRRTVRHGIWDGFRSGAMHGLFNGRR